MIEKENYWSRFADDFEKRNNFVAGKSDMNIVLNKISQQKKLQFTLELGCGNGTYSRILSNEASQFLATDYSDEMVESSKLNLKDLNNVRVEKANCFELNYGNNIFDTVFMANLLHIIPEPEKAILEAKRVLKPGGKLIILSFTFYGMKLFHKLGMIYRYVKTYGKPSPYASKINLPKAKRMIVESGFRIEEDELLGIKSKAIFVKAIKE